MRDLLTGPALSELLELRLPARDGEPPSSWCRPPAADVLLAAASPYRPASQQSILVPPSSCSSMELGAA